MPTTYHLIKDRILSKGTLFHHVFTLLRGKFKYELTKKKAMDYFRTNLSGPTKKINTSSCRKL